MVAAKVYVEGGGDRRDLKTRCRKGFSKFFEKAGLEGRMPKVIACGGRKAAYDDFCTALQIAKAEEFIVLLVDSEDPVPDGMEPWVHLAAREGDGWTKPSAADNDNAHLMVQCMETWFLADKEALKSYFGQGFNEQALPKNPELERIPKRDILDGLKRASSRTTKGIYSKGDHSFVILSLIDPSKVQGASKHAKTLIEVLSEKLWQSPLID